MITPTVILGIMSWLLVWAEKHVGITSSISRLFYHNKTKKVFKAALWVCGGVLIYHDLGDPLLTASGLALIGVPIFGDFEDEVTKWFHYSMAILFFVGTAMYISPWMLLIMAAGTGFGLKFIKKNKLYWLEVMGIVTLVSGFYII